MKLFIISALFMTSKAFGFHVPSGVPKFVRQFANAATQGTQYLYIF